MARGEVHALGHDQIGSGERECVLVERQGWLVDGRCAADLRHSNAVGNASGNHVLAAARGVDGRGKAQAASAASVVRRHHELLQDAGISFGLGVHAVAAHEGDDVALLEGVRTSSQGDSGRAVDGHSTIDGVTRSRSRGAGRLVGDQGVFVEVEATRATHRAFAVLLLDRCGVLEQALETVHQIHVVLRVQQNGSVVVHGSQSVVQHLARGHELAEGDCGADVVHVLVNVEHHRQRICLDVGSQHRHGGVKDALGEVIQAHGQVNRSEVQVNALLRGDLQGCADFAGVLCAQGRAGANRVLVRQANLERIANLCTGLGKRVVVVSLDVADEVQLLVEDAQRLAGHCGGGKNAVGHVGSWRLSALRVERRSYLRDLICELRHFTHCSGESLSGSTDALALLALLTRVTGFSCTTGLRVVAFFLASAVW